ncbi:MAG: beta-hydroxyacyl-ACP dehydratase, partial [Planctomycetes bacterium]|nr:beta-hydroxyacyl-ACP dehydratase [Planctomycetota bacterium]
HGPARRIHATKRPGSSRTRAVTEGAPVVRFLLLDRFTAFHPGVRGRAVKNVSLSDDVFDDHFPLEPVFPGVLMLEGMAQLSGLLVEEGVRRATGRRLKAVLTIVEKAKFRRMARPGDQLEYLAEVESTNELGGTARVEALIGGERAAECRFTFALQAFENAALEARRGEILSLWLAGVPVDGGA